MRLSPSALFDRLIFAPPGSDRAAALVARPYAHRGRHDGGRVENSRSAFAAAIAAGDGIELDVRLSYDADAVVFHDATLDRLTGVSGPVARLSMRRLAEITLGDGGDSIQSLSQVLDQVGGQVPLLVEIKAGRRLPVALCYAVRRALEGYGGVVGVMSFHPEVSRWFARQAPHLLRGLVIGAAGSRGWPRWRGRIVRLWSLLRARPQFLACDIRGLPLPLVRRARRAGVPVLAWTVRTDDDQALAVAEVDQIIHERAMTS